MHFLGARKNPNESFRKTWFWSLFEQKLRTKATCTFSVQAKFPTRPSEVHGFEAWLSRSSERKLNAFSRCRQKSQRELQKDMVLKVAWTEVSNESYVRFLSACKIPNEISKRHDSQEDCLSRSLERKLHAFSRCRQKSERELQKDMEDSLFEQKLRSRVLGLGFRV